MAGLKSVKSSHPFVILLIWILLVTSLLGLLTGLNAQNAYRPYRPISNIFGSLFRPGVGPPPPQRRTVGQAPISGIVSSNVSNNQNQDNDNPAQKDKERPGVQKEQKKTPSASGSGQRTPPSPPTGSNIPPPPPVPQSQNSRDRDPRQNIPLPPRRPPLRPPPPPRPVPLRGSPPRILLRPQGPHGPLIGPLPKRPPKGPVDPIPSLGQVLTLVSTTVAAAQDESTPASTTASHSSVPHHSSAASSDELLAPTTDSSLYIIDELNRAVPGIDVHNSLEDSFLPPPTAASLVGSPPGLDHHHSHHHESSESRTLSPGFKVRPRGHSAPVIISQVPVKSFQSSSQKVTELPMPDKQHNHNHHNSHQDHDHNDHHDHHHPHDLSTADSQRAEQLTPYPQPRFYDPLSSRTFDRSQDKSRSNSKRFHFGNHNHNHGNHGNHGSHNNNNRENRLLATQHNHGGHDQHHQHHNEIIERIDEVIELVDCGGRDLGFCDMSSKYPGHMMGNLMSDCQELVYSGFVPVPDDLDELGDSNPVAKYSNSSKSTVRAQTGSWSWKPYTYESKQICDSELRFIRPGYARDSTGKWQVVVQTEDLPQRVAIDLCHAPGTPCHSMSDCGRKSRCIQRYNFQHLLAVDPGNLHSCPTIRAFKFPSSCVCHIDYPNHHEDYY